MQIKNSSNQKLLFFSSPRFKMQRGAQFVSRIAPRAELIRPSYRTCFTTTNKSVVWFSQYIEPIARPRRAAAVLATVVGLIAGGRTYSQSKRDEITRNIKLEGSYTRTTGDLLMSLPVSMMNTSGLAANLELDGGNDSLTSSQQRSLHYLLLQMISSGFC